jgi:hypothetical protein
MTIDDTEIYYEEHGTGTPFLVMHGGLGVDHSYFRPPTRNHVRHFGIYY